MAQRVLSFLFLSFIASCSSLKTTKIVVDDKFRTIPKGKLGQIVERSTFILQYNSECKVSHWVSYKISAVDLLKNVKRTNDFRPDPLITGPQASLDDYKWGGYDRGHLARADLYTKSLEDMRSSFVLSNMVPQFPYNNQNGSWRRLEDLEYKNIQSSGSLLIVSGPVFLNSTPQNIGEGKVCVPDALFKVLFDPRNGGDAIGFIIPNNFKSKEFEKYAVSVRRVEEVTGLDFFSELPRDVQEIFETKVNFLKWNTSENIKRQNFNGDYGNDSQVGDSFLLEGYDCGEKLYRTPRNYCYAEKNDKKVRVKNICCEKILK